MVQISEAELGSIDSPTRGHGEPLFKITDTTMSVANPKKWSFLIEAGGCDSYKAEVFRQANRWGTLAEIKMAQGETLNRRSLEALSLPQPGDAPVSFVSVRQVFFSNWKYAGQF